MNTQKSVRMPLAKSQYSIKQERHDVLSVVAGEFKGGFKAVQDLIELYLPNLDTGAWMKTDIYNFGDRSVNGVDDVKTGEQFTITQYIVTNCAKTKKFKHISKSSMVVDRYREFSGGEFFSVRLLLNSGFGLNDTFRVPGHSTLKSSFDTETLCRWNTSCDTTLKQLDLVLRRMVGVFCDIDQRHTDNDVETYIKWIDRGQIEDDIILKLFRHNPKYMGSD